MNKSDKRNAGSQASRLKSLKEELNEFFDLVMLPNVDAPAWIKHKITKLRERLNHEQIENGKL